MINKFEGKYHFLSNFFIKPITYNGLKFTNVEAAFQSQKTLDLNEQAAFQEMNPSQAKSAGRRIINLRPDWTTTERDRVMTELCRIKFSNPEMKTLLLQTGNEELVEGNDWGDIYWGIYNGIGFNKLGKILMQIREEIKGDSPHEIH